MVMATSVLLGACTQETKKTDEAAPLIKRTEVKSENGVLTPEVLYSMARVSDAQVSPDGAKFFTELPLSVLNRIKAIASCLLLMQMAATRNRLQKLPKANKMLFGLKAVKR